MSPEPESTQTFLFADLAGYTALTEIHGDQHAADAAADFFRATRALLESHNAEEIKSIGDALMLRSSDAVQAARLAERIVCDYGSRHRALGIRVGMHTGSAVRRGTDWFGAAVNVASRVADLARAGEVLLTAATRRALGEGAMTRRRGARRLKNLSDRVEIYELVFDVTNRALPVDPVCRMALDPALAPERRVYRGATYVLCSETCARRFDQEPSRYTRRSGSRDQLLVSDDARERTATRLQRAYARGRLEEDELEDRVARTLEARTRGELDIATDGLPRRFRRRPFPVLLYRWLTRPLRRWLRRRR